MIVVFAISRLFFLGIGAWAFANLPHARPGGSPLPPPGPLSYWANWDGAWYVEIAAEGYTARDPASTAFFPLYPMLVRVLNILPGEAVFWGMVVSLVAGLFALFFVYEITRSLFDVRTARAATLVLAFFPTAYYFNAVYTEALFLAFSAGCVWAALVRRDLMLAGLLGGFAAATRNLGIFLLLPLAWEWWRNREAFGGWRGLAPLLFVPAGLVGYMLFLWVRYGNPMISAAQQTLYWGREFESPAAIVAKSWRSAQDGIGYLLNPQLIFFGESAAPAFAVSNSMNLGFLALFLVLIVFAFFRLPPGLAIFALIVVALPALAPSPWFPLMSLPRFILGAFPIFIVIGVLLSHSRYALLTWLIASGVLGAALTMLFASWRWVA